MLNPRVMMRANPVRNLPRTLIEDYKREKSRDIYTEPLALLYGEPMGYGFVNTSIHNIRNVRRKIDSVELAPDVDDRLLGYDEAIESDVCNGIGQIGQAHGHYRRKFLPIPGKRDLKTIRAQMENKNLDRWVEIVLWYKDINPEGLEKFIPGKRVGIVYQRDDGRPRLRIFNADRNLGLDVTFFAFEVQKEPAELPVYFARRAFRRFCLIL